MLVRIPALYVMADLSGIVRFSAMARAGMHEADPIALTWAYWEHAQSMRAAARTAAEDVEGAMMIPGMEIGRINPELAVSLMIGYRDAIHRRMGWPAGPLKQ